MRRIDRIAVGLAVIVAATIGCGSQPVPLVAVAGTTITLALPSNFPTGYGRALVGDTAAGFTPLTDEDSPLEDLQNGEMLFALVDPATGTNTAVLDVRQILRVGIDPASRAATDPVFSGLSYSKGQVIAFLDIPASVAAGDYEIRITRLRRPPGDPSAVSYEAAVAELSNGSTWQGWGNGTSPTGVPITIKTHDGQEHFTPLTGWLDVPAGGGLGWDDVSTDLELMAPFPEFTLRVPDAASAGTETPPAAWEIEITYPRSILRIRGVSLASLDRSAALVMWQAADPNGSVPCSEPDDTLKIQVIDPSRRTKAVRVAYQLRNFSDAACGRRATASDFQPDPASFVAYDENGVAMASSFEIPAFPD